MDDKIVSTVEDAYTDMLKEADSYFADKKYHQAIDILITKAHNYDPHILWRLARCFFFYDGKYGPANNYAQRAAELDDTIGEVCKWAAILFTPSLPNKVTGKDINQFNYYVTEAIQSDPDLDSQTYERFAKVYLKLLELESREITKSELRCQVVCMLEKAEEAAKKSPKMMKTTPTPEPNPKDKDIFRRMITMYREVIKKFGSSKDPDETKVSKSTIFTIYHLDNSM